MSRLHGSLVGLILSVVFAWASPELLQQDNDLVSLLPREAWDGPGTWTAQELCIATGHSTDIDALGKAKGRHIEEKIASDDARRRLLFSTLPEGDRELFDITGELTAARTAAIYRLPGRSGLFVVVVVPKRELKVKPVLNAARGRSRAIALMKAGDVETAARVLSRLTELGVQDPETLDHARAASAEINLRKSVKGATERSAWAFLGGYYERHGDLEASLKAWHQLYLLLPEPDRTLLEKLADLSKRTHRANNADAFHQEILRRWPPPSHP
ncbi:hypothetical protein [Prosthecobacter sp.]|uniref:hypothetical protein n=1 Tax=Prosthecobacter sp. TaxID=1965333 RepID=UPI001DFCE1E6|nr:hypothetical protein [Prosthecobacter sp.]MCB1279051.1 hypothetical protein [Prosthecobacter sp.]